MPSASYRRLEQPSLGSKPKVYIPHAGGWDYENKLYRPIRKLHRLSQRYDIILPHETGRTQYDSKKLLGSGAVAVVIAEVSTPSFGVGIELGWADASGVPIGYIHQEGTRVSDSLRVLSRQEVSYRDDASLLAGIELLIEEGLAERERRNILGRASAKK